MAWGTVKIGALDINDYTTYVVNGLTYPGFVNSITRLGRAAAAGSVASFIRNPEVEFSIEGWIHGDTEAAVEASRDALLIALRGEMEVRLGFQDLRYWLARLTAIEWEIINPLGYAYSAEFVALEPFAYANAAATDVTSTTALSLVSGSTYKKTVNVPVAGTALTWPYITVEIPAGGPYGITEIYVYNPATDQRIQLLPSAFAASDIFTLDGENGEYKQDGVEIDYYGQGIQLDPAAGTNALEVWAVATSTPTLNVTVAYRNRYK